MNKSTLYLKILILYVSMIKKSLKEMIVYFIVEDTLYRLSEFHHPNTFSDEM